MENNKNSYNQQPIGQMPMQGAMIPQQRGHIQRQPMSMQQKMRSGSEKIMDAFPKWLTQYPILVYILTLTIVSFMYSRYCLPWYYMLSGTVAVLVFFLYGTTVARDTTIDKIRRSQRFEKHLFIIALVPRVLYTLLLFWIFQSNYGDAFGFEDADAIYYDSLGQYVSRLISEGNFHFVDEISQWSGNEELSDMGYGIYVGFIYWLTGSSEVSSMQIVGNSIVTASALSILTVRFIKCILSSLTVLLVYELAKRNFGDQTARIAAIFCALWPNFWYYCTGHLKEVEMVFLTVLFVEQADQMLRSRQFTAWKVIPVLLIAAAIFTMRTPLGMVALLALVFSVVMSSSKVVTWGKRIIVGLLAVALVFVVAGNQLEEKAKVLIESQKEQQEEGINWYATRKDKGGNQQSFAQYASTAVFAPLIFTLPFPSMVRPFEGQEGQQLNNGGNFIKNIISAFTIFAMVILLMSGEWREHLLPLSFMLGYLAVLALSSFAHSERFHQPVMPFEFMFSAYGLSIALTKKKYKRWFLYWCGLMSVAAIAWNWFKIAGRGLA